MRRGGLELLGKNVVNISSEYPCHVQLWHHMVYPAPSSVHSRDQGYATCRNTSPLGANNPAKNTEYSGQKYRILIKKYGINGQKIIHLVKNTEYQRYATCVKSSGCQ